MEVNGPDDASIIVYRVPSPIGCASPEGDGTPTPVVVPFTVVCDASPPQRTPGWEAGEGTAPVASVPGVGLITC